MSEEEFFSVMGMEVLTHRGRPVDVRLDGYLAKASSRANRRRSSGRRLVFGYRDGKREIEKATVVLVDHQVTEVRSPDGPPLQVTV